MKYKKSFFDNTLIVFWNEQNISRYDPQSVSSNTENFPQKLV